MNVVRRIVETLVERFVASIGSMFAARLESVSALMHAAQQDELEERARQFEDDGKAHLAADLRSRASLLASNMPGPSGHEMLQQVPQDHDNSAAPRIAHSTEKNADRKARGQVSETTSSRPAKRRSCRRSKPTDSSGPQLP